MTVPQPLRRFWKAIRGTAGRFMEVDPLTEAGSLAFTTIFALPGVFIIALTVASWFYDPGDVRKVLYGQAGAMIGRSTSEDLEGMVAKASEQERGTFARVLGVAALVISATTAFAALQSSLNKVWRVQAKPGRALARYLFTRLISLGLIAAFGFLLLVSLVLDSALVAMAERLGGAASERTMLAGIGALFASFVVITMVFAMVFKFLPDVRVPWRSIWVGALFTSALFSVGKYLIGLYIAKSGAGDAFGAGGAVIIIMLWVYYSAILVLFGAQYTQVVTVRDEGAVEPARQARLVEDRQRARNEKPRSSQ